MTGISWNRSLTGQLGMLLLLVALVALGLVIVNLYAMRALRADAASRDLTRRGPARLYQMLSIEADIAHETGADRVADLRKLRDAIARMDQRYLVLLNGDPAAGIPPTTDPRLLADLRQREQFWRIRLRPLAEQLARGDTDAATAAALRARFASAATDLIEMAEKSIDLYDAITEEKQRRFRNIELALLLIGLAGLIAAFMKTRGVARRVRGLSQTAQRIAAGELDLKAPDGGSDELAVLGQSFNSMTASLNATLASEQKGREKLEKAIAAVRETVNSVSSASAEILAATTQQAAGAQEQAAAVTETVTTVDEVTQTADQAAERARTVADSARRSAEISQAGRNAIEETVNVIGTVSTQTESIAESILSLAEQAQAIGEIIASVNDIAEQTNILALNAAIEAARAGEQGKAFTVVAGEVKALAEQSKKATAQVRQILGEIQKATNRAVMAAEHGTRSVSDATTVVHQAGDTIKALADTINEASQMAGQIAASASQQAIGMTQIHGAMKNISEVTHQGLASTRQSENAAQDLNRLARRLDDLLSDYA